MGIAKRNTLNSTPASGHSVEFPRVRTVSATARGQMLDVVWSNGERSKIDVIDPIRRLKVFAPLEDRALFARVHTINDGLAIAWTDELDYSADALHRLADRQRAPKNAA